MHWRNLSLFGAALIVCICSSGVVVAEPTDGAADICHEYKLKVDASQAASELGTPTEVLDLASKGKDKAKAGVGFFEGLRTGNGLKTAMDDGKVLAADGTLDLETLQNYGFSFVPFAGASIGLFGLTFLCCPFFFCARCCMSTKCCKPRKSQDEYSMCSKLCPLMFYIAISLASAGLAMFGVVNALGLVAGFVKGLCSIAGLTTDSAIMFDQIVVDMGEVNTTLDNFYEYSEVAFLSQFQPLHEFVPVFMDDLEAFADKVAAESVPSDPSNPFFTTKAQEMYDIVKDVNGSLYDILGDMDTVENDARTGIELFIDIVKGTTGNITTTSSTFSSAIKDYEFASLELNAVLAHWLQYAMQFSMGFFASVFFSVVAGLVAFLLYLTPCKCDSKVAKKFMTLSWSLTYIFMVFLFLLSGILMPFFFIMSDTCELISLPSNDTDYDMFSTFRALTPDPGMIGAAEGCFGDTPVPLLKSISELTASDDDPDPVAAISSIGNNMPDVAGTVSFDTLLNYINETEHLIPEDMGIDTSTISTLLANLNALTASDGNSYTEANCTPTLSCDEACVANACAPVLMNPSTDPATLASARDPLMAILKSRREAEEILTWMASDVQAFKVHLGTFEVYAGNIGMGLYGTFMRVRDDDVGTMIKSSGDCGFMRVAFANFHNLFCDETLTAVSGLALSMFFIAFLGIPMVALSVIINIRCFGDGNKGFVAPTEFVLENK